MRDVRFRRALSLAIDRDELNQVVYIGPGQALQQHDHGALGAVQARVCDQVGELRSQARQQAARRGRPHQARRRRASACCPTAGRRPSWSSMPSEETEDADALQLIADYWKKVGIKMLTKPQTRENFRLRAFSGEAIMTAYAGVVTAVPTPTPAPRSSRRPCRAACNGRAGACSSSPRASRARSATCRIGLQAARLRQGVGDARPTTRCAARRWDEDPADQRRRGVLDRHGERHPPARSWSARRSATCRRKAITPGIPADISASISPTRSGSRRNLASEHCGDRALSHSESRGRCASDDHRTVSIFGRLCAIARARRRRAKAVAIQRREIGRIDHPRRPRNRSRC